MLILSKQRYNEHRLKRPALILKQVIQFSSLHRQVHYWYDKPVQFTMRIKKSTLIILGLILYIVYLHLHPTITPVIKDAPPITTQKSMAISILQPLKVPDIKPVEAVEAVSAPVVAPAPVVEVGSRVPGCGDNSYASFIYMHESGCNTYDPNPTSGACGIGQAWPCSKLPCGHTAADYACQNIYFTSYAVTRYGSWLAAYNFWVANKWW